MARAKNARSGNGRTQQTLEGKTSLIPINLEDEIRRRAYASVRCASDLVS